jgi:hypothetical protein
VPGAHPHAPGAVLLGDSTLVAWYRCLYAPRTVFVTGSDPVRLGFFTSLNRAGGNMTGVDLFVTELLPNFGDGRDQAAAV